ncbi:hypothetical protein BGZ59_006583 [Podila verticillata]|nr:hypothetical protein BGZ59_006583 [Podila verticillata]KFH73605.1 hypothetical protein MVEG_00820 [Podila verticillata NRRL 6337]
MNMYNTDSGFRPPSPLNFAAPGPGLFGESINYEDFRFSNPDFLLPTSPPPLTNDPTLQLFNPSEQRYFSEFLDTLVVDQDFTFDPSSIPNLPSLPMFPPESLPGFLNNQLQLPQQQQQPQQQQLAFPNNNPNSNPLGSMDYESSQGNYGSHSPNASYANNVTPAKRKTNKAETTAPTGAPSRPSSLDALPTKISTPIQQLSKLTLESTNHIEANNHHSGDTTRPSKSKKNKRDEDSHPYARSSSSTSSRSNSHSNARKEDSRENASVSDEYASDAAGSSSTPKGSSTTPTTKRKPYKELLTEEEKRANHIASEQKRRNTIRNGFKDMTDIIPDLKDINSSKSTILFKAVDFIKYLEKRNKTLQEKADLLESRLQQRNGGRETNGYHKGHSQQRHAQDSYHNRSHYPSNGVTERLQDIPNFYPVS